MSIARVTQRMLVTGSVDQLQSGLSRLAKVQEQLSTGRVVNRPSDAPTEAATAMRLRAEIAQQTQYSRNADNGLGWLATVDTALSGMSDSVRRAREIALQGASSGTASDAARQALAAEVDQLRAGLSAHANASFLGRPVFGGVTAGETAFDSTTGAYVGAPGQVLRTVGPGVAVRVDVSGPEVLGPDGDSLFDDLSTLSAALVAGDTSTIRTVLDSLQGRLDVIGSTQATAGAAVNRLETAARLAQDATITLGESRSQIEDTDLAKAMVDLKLQEVAYQAALGATARVMQPSLMDFMR
ncbi:flagellar hook-associated protein FlgL [Nocardioides sp.]|uniref:flagellar hook-associated protein FlgL n=1 Tax=Nocardioides sp. TaxID=35761 RepID=UPI002B26FCB0|nr:flagellar hook-associated protein FlgL [Nocardioides sp.]